MSRRQEWSDATILGMGAKSAPRKVLICAIAFLFVASLILMAHSLAASSPGYGGVANEENDGIASDMGESPPRALSGASKQTLNVVAAATESAPQAAGTWSPLDARTSSDFYLVDQKASGGFVDPYLAEPVILTRFVTSSESQVGAHSTSNGHDCGPTEGPDAAVDCVTNATYGAADEAVATIGDEVCPANSTLLAPGYLCVMKWTTSPGTIGCESVDDGNGSTGGTPPYPCPGHSWDGMPAAEPLPPLPSLQRIWEPECGFRDVLGWFLGHEESPGTPGLYFWDERNCGRFDMADLAVVPDPGDQSDPFDGDADNETAEPDGQNDLVQAWVLYVDRSGNATVRDDPFRGSCRSNTTYVYRPDLPANEPSWQMVVCPDDLDGTPEREFLAIQFYDPDVVVCIRSEAEVVRPSITVTPGRYEDVGCGPGRLL